MALNHNRIVVIRKYNTLGQIRIKYTKSARLTLQQTHVKYAVSSKVATLFLDHINVTFFAKL